MTAGLSYASGLAVVPMDVDLQDPPEVLLEFVRKFDEGFDVVLGIRADRKKDTFLKRTTYFVFLNRNLGNLALLYRISEIRIA